MAPYSPPTSGRAGKLRLDFNENTVGASPRVVEFLLQRLSEEGLAVYPEYDEVRPKLAAFFGLAPNQVLLTNGTDEAIQVLVNTYVDDRDDVVLLRPSYAMYRFYNEVAGACIREIDYRPRDLAFPLDELLDAIRPETRAVLIANPNNPTGTGTDQAGIRRILEAAPHAAVLIDEAYFEFSGVTALPLLDSFPNLFVSRTFSKVYGMAAMRMGCLFSRAENVAYMRKAQSPYSVNMLAALAAEAAIADPDYVKHYVAEALAAREMIYEGFEQRRIPYYRSEANFVLFRAGDRAIVIRDYLRSKGVLVRDRSYELPGCVRVTVGAREQVKRFFEVLDEVW
ncbi:MAG: histidinol-phosphate transaminase [Bryobacteraceae bacterium]|nr:histidinol-phosphate transaminase [Bryobacteraceae bacterium]